MYDNEGSQFAPKTVSQATIADIDATYDTINYNGEHIVLPMQHQFGIKNWASRAASLQGVAVYDDIMVCVAASPATTHYIYRINNDNTLTTLATFTMNLGHGNALQFAPIKQSGQYLPYLYVAAIDKDNQDRWKTFVLNIDQNHTVTKVQTIYSAITSQMLIGDDGHIWGSGRAEETVTRRQFAKYRRVDVSEGDVTLTSDDIIESWETEKWYNNTTQTAQGWSVKFGKIWFCYGPAGNGNYRGIDVYDTATQRLDTELDLTNFTTLELEDVDFYADNMVIATYNGQLFIARF